MFKVSRRVLSGLALLAAIGCSNDEGTDPEESISISTAASTLTVAQGVSGNVMVTLLRGGGFVGAVNITVEDVPAGATASVSPGQLIGEETQATITVTVASSLAAGSYPITVRASASGLGAVTTQYTLVVTTAPAATYTLTSSAVSVAPGGSGTSTIGIQRGTFTGAVALALDNPPAGITGTFNPASTTGNTSVLTINAASTVAAGTYNLTVKGTATGQTDKTTTLALTVTGPSSYTLTATPASVNITAGQSANTTVSITRTNFTGTVTLALDAPPAGITGTFTPATLTGATVMSSLQVSVASTVVPGNYTLTIKGTATGVADKTTTVTVIVAAAAAVN
jgi:trimeric autotransporter adhesin